MDLNITYEDGLRLSELYGRRDELLYQLDHVDMEAAIVTIFIAMFVVLGLGLYLSYMRDIGRIRVRRGYDDEEEFQRHMRDELFLLVVIGAAVIIVSYFGLQVLLEYVMSSDLANINGQIEGILYRYQ